MNRRGFLLGFGVTASAAVFVPKLIVPKWRSSSISTLWLDGLTYDQYGFAKFYEEMSRQIVDTMLVPERMLVAPNGHTRAIEIIGGVSSCKDVRVYHSMAEVRRDFA